MGFIEVDRTDSIVALTLSRGKVNALNSAVLQELRKTLEELEGDPAAGAIVLTGQGKFFSFGFDIPEFLTGTKEEFSDFLHLFTSFYSYLFLYPKPVITALNGHAIAGGCILALACDRNLMVTGKAKIALNEITFGASLFAGCTEMLRHRVCSANAAEILYSGDMYSAEDAKKLGLVDQVTTDIEMMARAGKCASDLASKHPQAFAGMKSLLRGPVAGEMARREEQSIQDFLKVWYSERTVANLKRIEIY